MIRHRAFFSLSAVLSLAAAAISAVGNAIDRLAAAFVELMPTDAAALPRSVDHAAPAIIIDGRAFPAGLIQSLRHEARVPRLSAARGC